MVEHATETPSRWPSIHAAAGWENESEPVAGEARSAGARGTWSARWRAAAVVERTATCRNPIHAAIARAKRWRSGMRRTARRRRLRSIRRKSPASTGTSTWAIRRSVRVERRGREAASGEVSPGGGGARRRRSRSPRASVRSARGSSSGGSCRSASMITTASPSACSRPAVIAIWWPKLREQPHAPHARSRAASSPTRRAVGRCSRRRRRGIRTEPAPGGQHPTRRSYTAGRFSSSLRNGQTTTTVGGAASASATRASPSAPSRRSSSRPSMSRGGTGRPADGTRERAPRRRGSRGGCT